MALASGHGEPSIADDAVEATELFDHFFGAGRAHRVDHGVVVDLAPRSEQQVVA